MNAPRAVVVPFGVPEEGRGLGLGLAAIVHSFVQIGGDRVAIAQLYAAAPAASPATGPNLPIEAYISPSAWRDMAARGDTTIDPSIVVTGAFEPPYDGEGALRLMAFDPADGRTCAAIDVAVDGKGAGASIVEALDRLCAAVGGHLGVRDDLRELGWDALESVLRAEGCALVDPARGAPRDRLAAMLHLGRAVDDAPAARYPAERLAAVAAEAAHRADGAEWGAAALRALQRAAGEGAAHAAIEEALASVLVRLGRAGEAEGRLNAAIAAAPSRPRLHVLLSQALRAQGRYDAALAALDACVAGSTQDQALLAAERGAALGGKGDLAGASAAWRHALADGAVWPAAFVGLGALALRAGDFGTAQWLVDRALTARDLAPDVARFAVQLAIATEPEGVARAARLARLAERWIECSPAEAPARLVLARSLVALGEAAKARLCLDHIDRVAPASPSSAEARIIRLQLDAPAAADELARLVRAAQVDPVDRLADVAARARQLATLHDVWLGWLAAGTAERRRSRWAMARYALELAVAAAPGAASAHVELARVLVALGLADRAVVHAETASALEGPSPVVLDVLARALQAADRRPEALAAAHRALALQPGDVALQKLAAALAAPSPVSAPASWVRHTRRTVLRAWAALARLSGT